MTLTKRNLCLRPIKLWIITNLCGKVQYFMSKKSHFIFTKSDFFLIFCILSVKYFFFFMSFLLERWVKAQNCLRVFSKSKCDRQSIQSSAGFLFRFSFISCILSSMCWWSCVTICRRCCISRLMAEGLTSRGQCISNLSLVSYYMYYTWSTLRFTYVTFSGISLLVFGNTHFIMCCIFIFIYGHFGINT